MSGRIRLRRLPHASGRGRSTTTSDRATPKRPESPFHPSIGQEQTSCRDPHRSSNSLNEVLTAELTAINQYFIHAKMCENWGFERLAAKIRDESIDEMKRRRRAHRAHPVPRGLPNLQRLNPVRVGETVLEQLRARSRSRARCRRALQPGHRPAVAEGDNGTRDCSSVTSSARRSTPTGSRPSSTLVEQSASRTTWRSRSAVPDGRARGRDSSHV